MERREAQTSDGKGKSSRVQHNQNFNLQSAFIQIPGGGKEVQHIKGSFYLELAGCSPKEQLEIHVF